MVQKIFKGVWFFSVLAFLVMFFYVYAGLGEYVTLWESTVPTTISKNGLFYGTTVLLAMVNVLVYVVRKLPGQSPGFIAWFYGMITSVNLFFIAVFGFIHVLNSGEHYDYSSMAPTLYGSLILVGLWIISWPVIRIFLRVNAK